MKAIAIFVASILSLGMIDRFVLIAPLGEATIDVVFIRVNEATEGNRFGDDRFNSRLFHISEHPNDYLTVTLDHAQDRRLFFLQGTTPTTSLEAMAAPFPFLGLDCLRVTLVTGDKVDFVTLDFTA